MSGIKWQNTDAGPRQLKDFSRAVGALRSEGQARDELTGAIGGQERRSTVIAMMGAVRPEVTALEEAIGERYGWQLSRANVREVTAAYVTALAGARKSRPVEDNRRSAEEEAERLAAQEARDAKYRAAEAAGEAVMTQVMAKAPAGARALIIAEWQEDASDIQTDYFNARTTRTVAIGFRMSSREDFRALHAAAAKFPETAGTEFSEHRENYSMGAGNYLSDHNGTNRGTGWVIRSAEFPCKWRRPTEDAIPEPEAQPEPQAPAAAPERPASASQRSTQVDDDTLGVIARADIDGNALRFTERLDRATYTRAAEVLAAVGGKWNRKAQAFLFPCDAAPLVADLLGSGQVVTAADEGWFPTPGPVVAQVLEAAELVPGMEVLEPSAGEGAIAKAAADAGAVVDCAELNGTRAASLCTAGIYRTVTCGDFLAIPQRPAYDRVLMNPPFADKAALEHVRHAAGFLRPGGLLVAVMPNSVSFGTDRVTAGFRELVTEAGGEITPLPDDAFKVSGTGVRTVLVTLPAAAAQAAAA